jgi:glycosyltransferase involved in cell wall biosynthesis
MKTKNTNEILFVSSFPPRECGIATYTQDLMNSISEKFGNSFSLSVCALENNNQSKLYSKDVKYVLNTSNYLDYINIACNINNDKNIKIVFIQHEFGLFAGEFGEMLLYFLYSLDKPFIIAFHTVLPTPSEKRKHLINSIISASSGVVVMTQNSKEILKKDYLIADEQITVIHHGTHLVDATKKNELKSNFDVEGKFIFSTFGLLSSGKSIETALDALPAVKEKNPNVIYYILGKTHPEIVKKEGEKYREFLEKKVLDLGITTNVIFVNRYLSLEDLIEYLQLTDVYLFTSKDPHQAVSGTFSYAMSCSCPIISTPIPHAREMLKDNAGIIVDFQNSEQLSIAMNDLISNDVKRREMSLNALRDIRPSAWQNSAIAHSNLFNGLIKNSCILSYSIPEISLDQIKRLTTKKGMIQFSKINHPDISSGFTLDDNARALIALTKHFILTKDMNDIRLINTYFDFIEYTQMADGTFANYVDDDGNYHTKNKTVNLEDSLGRAIWALGEFIYNGNVFSDLLNYRAERMIEKSLSQIQNLKSPRAIAFALKGLYFYSLVKPKEEIDDTINKLANSLLYEYQHSFDNEWKWFENSLTYANSIIPEAMLYAYLKTRDYRFKETAKSSFDFLLSIIMNDQKIKVISNQGWHTKGNKSNKFGEQPIDVAYTIISLDLFYEVFGLEEYRTNIINAFGWFHGNNHLNQIIYNPTTGGCHDGLEEHNVNLNQGAESSVCYLLARITMEKYKNIEEKSAIKLLKPDFHEIKIKSIELSQNGLSNAV